MSYVIKVQNISKAYQLGQIGTGTISRDLERWYARFRGKEDPFIRIGESNVQNTSSKSDVVWSLKDINFEIEQGEAVGIIGRNGAGKSTLLKILSKVTAPTTGKIFGKGRIASLLEVGTGFHPELSGRENIFLNGAILGMRKKEIQLKLEEIVNFAGVERYLDTPVKRYSSGMYVRLAFAVAAHLESEILIVDEVLAVGDAEFQKKCLGKMDEINKGEGRTVLFVSHNMNSIRKLCTKAMLLNQGQINFSGSIDQAIETYKDLGTRVESTYSVAEPKNSRLMRAFAKQIRIEDSDGKLITEIPVGSPWQIAVDFKVNEPIDHFIIAVGIINNVGVDIRTAWSNQQQIRPGQYVAVFKEENLIFSAGTYHLNIGLSTYERSIQYVENAASFTISNSANPQLQNNILRTENVGLILNPMDIKISTTSS